MKKPKMVIVTSQGKVSSIYVTPDLYNQIDIQTIDYDKEPQKKVSENTELIEMEIKEGMLLEQQ